MFALFDGKCNFSAIPDIYFMFAIYYNVNVAVMSTVFRDDKEETR